MINYSIVMRPVNANLFQINAAKGRIKAAEENQQTPDPADVALVATEKLNAFAAAQYTDVMTIEKFARHISTHGCVYSRADISAILYMAVDCMREQLLEGKKIRLGDLGDFSISLNSKGAESADKFTAQNITGIKVVWDAGTEFKNLMQDAEFNLVASRNAQAALIKAVKAGETYVDLTKPEGDDDPNGGGGLQNPLPVHPTGISITSIGGKTYGQKLTMVPGTDYPVQGTKLTDLSSDNFGSSESKSFVFTPISDETGMLKVDADNALSTNESTITCDVFEDQIFMIKAQGV